MQICIYQIKSENSNYKIIICGNSITLSWFRISSNDYSVHNLYYFHSGELWNSIIVRNKKQANRNKIIE